MVLCTGDGKGYSREEGFLYDVKGFIEDGWRLVLFSWDDVCHHSLRSFVEKRGTYESLEKYYEAVTFIKDGRRSLPLTNTAAGSSR
jgi:hypothetical protein